MGLREEAIEAMAVNVITNTVLEVEADLPETKEAVKGLTVLLPLALDGLLAWLRENENREVGTISASFIGTAPMMLGDAIDVLYLTELLTEVDDGSE